MKTHFPGVRKVHPRTPARRSRHVKWPTARRGYGIPPISFRKRAILLGPSHIERVMANVRGTIPERVIFKWLDDNCPWLWEYQAAVWGGRLWRGGAVLDFVIYAPGQTIALRLMSWWHFAPEQQMRDRYQLNRLAQEGYHVVDIWSREYMRSPTRVDYDALNEVMYAIIYGVR